MDMKIGNLPEMIRLRSVDKQIKHRRPEIVQEADTRLGASYIKLAENETLVMSSGFYIENWKKSQKVVDMAINSIVVKAAEPLAIMLGILMPPSMEEETLRTLMKELNQICERDSIELLIGQTEVAVAVNQPILSITAIGKKSDACRMEEGLKPSQELVMTGWAGMEGAAILAEEKMELLRSRYSKDFLEDAKEAVSDISVRSAASIAAKLQVNAMHELKSGGIFGALSELAAAYQMGFQVDMKKIPIRQETIEICEFFELNPYLLSSRGCLLLVTDHGNELVARLEMEDIKACVIGRMTADHGKVIINDGETRFLEPPKEDELSKAR